MQPLSDRVVLDSSEGNRELLFMFFINEISYMVSVALPATAYLPSYITSFSFFFQYPTFRGPKLDILQ